MSTRPAKTFPIALVGESHFQGAVTLCREGEAATVLHEFDNPYDERALVVKCARASVIGYIPRDSFLQRALLDEGRECTATIRAIATRKGNSGVVIEVKLLGKGAGGIAQCEFQPR